MAEMDLVHLPTEDPDDPVFLATCGPWLDHPRSWTDNMNLYPESFGRSSRRSPTREAPS